MPIRKYDTKSKVEGFPAAPPASRSSTKEAHSDPTRQSVSKGSKPSAHFASSAPAHNYTLGTNDHQREIYNTLKNLPPIPQLQEPKTINLYEEASIEDSLLKLIDSHDIIIVAGSFFGDEGKGKMVDAVARCEKCTCIARVNSGENAGHTILHNGSKMVFNLAPSGLLSEGKRNYVGPECVMDPISFMEKEVAQLVREGVPYHERLWIGNVYIVTPYHKLFDLLHSPPNSSTLMGMSPVHASKVTKRAIRLDHLFNSEDDLRQRFRNDMKSYFGYLKLSGYSDEEVLERCNIANSDGVERIPPHVIKFVTAEDKVDYLVQLYKERVVNNPLFPHRTDVIHELHHELNRGGKLLLEGPQSYWLSNAREKFWGSTTSADTSAAGLLAASQMNYQRFRTVVINIHKTPASSRVGLGACPSCYVPQDYFSSQGIRTLKDLPAGCCVDFEAIQKKLFEEGFKYNGDKFNGILEPVEYTDETGTYNIGVAMAIASAVFHGEAGAVTKKPRVCGFFDCVLQHEVNTAQGPYLSISALDRGDFYDKIGITIAYIYFHPENKEMDVNGKVFRNGDIIHSGSPVPSEVVLYHCYPIVKLIDGWKSQPISADKRKFGEPLPRGVCEVLSTIEYFTRCKVLSIGNGPNCEDIIYFPVDL